MLGARTYSGYCTIWFGQGYAPGIKARIKPFAREDGRFASIDELFKKAQNVEIRSNRDKRAGTTQNQPASTAEKRHGNNGGNTSAAAIAAAIAAAGVTPVARVEG
jgi:hypothetical protein